MAALAAVFVAAGVLVAVDPFAGSSGSANAENGASTSFASVSRRSLSAETQVSGTLGYAHATSVVVPAGTSDSAVAQAEQSLTQANTQLAQAEAGLAADERMLAQARAALAEDEKRKAPTVSADKQNVAADEDKVAADDRSVAAGKSGVSAAEQSLAQAEESETSYDSASSYTMLPSVGSLVRRGQALYAVNGRPVLLLYGRLTAWRAFRSGMSSGSDVAELNENLRALGYGKGLTGDAFTTATTQAIEGLQRARGLDATGELLLGSVVFQPGPTRITSVQPTLGQAVQPGPVLGVSSTARQVVIQLDAAQQAAVKVGDRVTITLPDNSTTPGIVSKVGTVAVAPSNDNQGGSSTPTVEVDVTPTHPAATGRLDQAPVQVSIVTASVRDALVVPVTALLALSGGGYAVEAVDATGAHRLIPVSLGLFDDAEGLVQVSGKDLRPGQRVVVPAS